MRDVDIRRALLARMAQLHPDKSDTLVVEELGVCQGLARVDLAVVNGTVHGYEIKSERDTLTRLKTQSDLYSKALEYVTIVAAPAHLIGIQSLVPPWWGIWTAVQVGTRVCLQEERAPARNPALSADALVQFLWRDEAMEILSQHNLAKGLSSKSRKYLWDRLSSNFDVDQLGDFVRLRLKRRPPNWRVPVPQE